MRLRALIEGTEGPPPAAPIDRPTPATVATPATHEGFSPQSRPTVATVATLPEPECWADLMRGLTIDGVRLDVAATVLDSLMAAGTIERALILGWDAREMIGLQRANPHDDPSRAGLVYSMRPGDAVPDIRDTGCAIAIAGTNVRHIWRRAPLPVDSTIRLPWESRKMPNPSTSSTTPENKAVMYVDRNEAGKIVGAWEDPQRDGQELVAIDDDGLQRFLAQPGGRYGATRWGQAKWF